MSDDVGELCPRRTSKDRKIEGGVRPQIVSVQIAVTRPQIVQFRWYLVESSITPDVLQTFKVKCQRLRSQRETSSARQIIIVSLLKKSGSLNLMLITKFWSEAGK